MVAISHRRVKTNGIEIQLAECGEGPVVLMVHGFPESWYSWREQLPALAAAGHPEILEVHWSHRGGHLAFPGNLDLGSGGDPGWAGQIMAWVARRTGAIS